MKLTDLNITEQPNYDHTQIIYSTGLITPTGVDGESCLKQLNLDGVTAAIKKYIPRLYPKEFSINSADPFSDTEDESDARSYIFVVAESARNAYFNILQVDGKLFYQVGTSRLSTGDRDIRSINAAAELIQRLHDMGIEQSKGLYTEAVEIPKEIGQPIKYNLTHWTNVGKPAFVQFDSIDDLISAVAELLPKPHVNMSNDPFSDVGDESTAEEEVIDVIAWLPGGNIDAGTIRKVLCRIAIHIEKNGSSYMYDVIDSRASFMNFNGKLIAKRLEKLGIQARLGDSNEYVDVQLEGIEPDSIRYDVIFHEPSDDYDVNTDIQMANMVGIDAAIKLTKTLARRIKSDPRWHAGVWPDTDDPFSDVEDEPEPQCPSISIDAFDKLPGYIGGVVIRYKHEKFYAFTTDFATDNECCKQIIDMMIAQFGAEMDSTGFEL